MDGNDVCRFCLSATQNTAKTTPETNEIFHACFGIRLRSFIGSKACFKCLNFLEQVRDFKLQCLESEYHLMNLPNKNEEEDDEVKPVIHEPARPEVVLLKPEDLTEVDNALDDFEWKESTSEETDEQREGLEKCPVCQKMVKGLRRHVKRHKNNQKGHYVECEVCKKAIKTVSKRSHMKIHESDPCTICGREFSSSAMPLHMLRHRNSKVYTDAEKEMYRENYCAICNTFSMKLSVHMKRIHTADLAACEICGETMHRLKITFHIKNVHIEPYECELCRKKYRNKNQIMQHIENVHLKIKNYTCAECSKEFYGKSLLRNHLKIHFKNQHVVCSLCEKAFRTQAELDRHMEAIHIRSGNIICTHCGARYNSQSALTYHVTHHHMRQPSNLDQTRRKYSEINGKCVCGELYFSRASFFQHLNADHKRQDGRFFCTCGRDYLKRDKLKVHLERYHKLNCIFHKKKKN